MYTWVLSVFKLKIICSYKWRIEQAYCRGRPATACPHLPLINTDNNKMDFLQTILGLGLLLFGLFIIVCSYIRQVQNHKNRNNPEASYSSPAPFIGPILVIVGLTLVSVELSPWMLLLFLLDPDTVLIVVGLIWLLFKGKRQQSWKALYKYSCFLLTAGRRAASVKVFRQICNI